MNKLFTFLFFSCLVALVLAGEIDFNKLREAAGKLCQKEQNVGDDVVAVLKSRELPSNEAQQCFLDCYYTKLGLIKDGKINSDGAHVFAKVKLGDDDKLPKVAPAFKNCEVYVQKFLNEKCAVAKGIRQCMIIHDDDFQVLAKAS